MESQTKGNVIIRSGGRFYKVFKASTRGNSNYTFKCKDLDTKEDKILQFNLSGFLEAADRAFQVMKTPKDIFFLDLDHNGEWKVVNEDQLRQA